VCVPPSVLSAAPTPGNLRFCGIAFLLQINYPRPLPLFYPPLPLPSTPLFILTACPSRSPPGRLRRRHSHAYLAATPLLSPRCCRDICSSVRGAFATSQALALRCPQLPLWPPEPDPLRANSHAISRLGPTAGPLPRCCDCLAEALPCRAAIAQRRLCPAGSRLPSRGFALPGCDCPAEVLPCRAAIA